MVQGSFSRRSVGKRRLSQLGSLSWCCKCRYSSVTSRATVRMGHLFTALLSCTTGVMLLLPLAGEVANAVIGLEFFDL